MEPFAQIIETLRSQGVIVPLPRKLRLKVSTRGERLASFDNLMLRELLTDGAVGDWKRYEAKAAMLR